MVAVATPTGALPRLATGVELLGPYRDSGLQDPPYLVRRAGRIVQVSRLLYAVTAAADGTRPFDEIAAVAAGELDRPLTADDVRFLVRNKLAPAGFLVVGDEAPSDPLATLPQPTDTRLLALRYRRALVSSEAMNDAARRAAPLFRPPVVTAVLAVTVALDVWLFGAHGVTPALHQIARTPSLLLFVVAAIWVSGLVHELGHAGGCHYSGGRPGAAGFGLYLFWPVLYTNVTDAYRLDRRGRLRTDLGGIYFNAICIVLLGAAYAVTGWEPLLAVVVIEHVLVLRQLVPWVRLDGFYIVSDLTGVPDILSRVRPALLSLLPGRPTHPDVRKLRPKARRILYGYLVSLVFFVVLVVIPGILLLPRTLAVSGRAIEPHLAAMGAAAGRWDTIMVIVLGVQVAVLAMPVAGLVLTVGYVLGRSVRLTPRSSRRSVRRWLERSELAIVDGADVPGGGAVDYFGFGPGGEVALFGVAVEQSPQQVAARLLAAAAELRASCDTLAPGDVQLLVLRPSRFGAALTLYPVTRCKLSQN